MEGSSVRLEYSRNIPFHTVCYCAFDKVCRGFTTAQTTFSFPGAPHEPTLDLMSLCFYKCFEKTRALPFSFHKQRIRGSVRYRNSFNNLYSIISQQIQQVNEVHTTQFKSDLLGNDRKRNGMSVSVQQPRNKVTLRIHGSKR